MKIGSFEIKLERVLVITVVVIVILLLADFNARIEDLSSKQDKLQSASTRATQVMQTQVALQTQVAFATSDAAVEEWAREQGHQAQPGDIVIVPLPAPGTTPVAEIVPPTPIPTPYTKLDVWMELIFGK